MIHFSLTVFWHAIICGLLTMPLIFIKKFKYFYQILLFTLFLPTALIEFMHLVIYNVPFHESSYITISAFNRDIASDFFYAYIHWYHLLFLLAYFVLLILLYRLKTIELSSPSRRILLLILCLCSPFIFRYNAAYLKSIPTIRMISVWKDYRLNYEKLTNQSIYTNPKMVVSINPKLQNELQIIVIGESTSARHLGLYGYKRNTNPRLLKIKKELILFENVYTDKVHTIESLLDIFTFPIDKNTSSTLIDVFNTAGYKTFWLSNQPFFEKSITPITLISKRASKSKFVNPINSDITDLMLLKSFDNLVKNLKNDKQIIIVHLRGTHIPYKNNYPANFEIFKGGKSKFGQDAAETINHYDNAVLFNDYILSKMIEIIRAKKGYAVSLTYFSDHGDEVYDKRDYFGHNQALLPSVQMTNVPCFIWLNRKMCTRKPRSTNQKGLQLKYISNTLLDLYQIEFDLLSKKKSYLH